MTLIGADISNLQGPPAVYRGLPWYQQAQFLIVQAINPPRPFRGWDAGGYTVEQLRTAKADGKLIGIYIFLWNTLADVASDIRARLALIPDDLAAELDLRVMVDVEDEAACPVEQRKAAIDTARAVCDEWTREHAPQLPPSGGYSRDEYITDFLGGYWPDGWVYWQCAPGAAPDDLLPMRPMRQFAIDSIDHDSLLESEVASHDTPAPADPAPEPAPERETPDDYPFADWQQSAIAYRGALDAMGAQLQAAEDQLKALGDQSGTITSLQDRIAKAQQDLAA